MALVVHEDYQGIEGFLHRLLDWLSDRRTEADIDAQLNQLSKMVFNVYRTDGYSPAQANDLRAKLRALSRRFRFSARQLGKLDAIISILSERGVNPPGIEAFEERGFFQWFAK